jgi:hypothetical protein
MTPDIEAADLQLRYVPLAGTLPLCLWPVSCLGRR